MACLGVHFAITEDVAKRLADADGDDEELLGIVEEVEEAWDEQHLFESDKAWDALHRCLSNGTLNAQEGEPPLNLCFFGGCTLNEESDYFIVLLDPSQVRAVADALPKVTRDWLRQRYDSLTFPDYDGEKGDEDFDYAWMSFEGLPAFFAKAAAEGRHVIFTVDQ